MPTITIDAQEFVNDICVDYSADRENWTPEYFEGVRFMRLTFENGASTIMSLFSVENSQDEGQHPLNLDETQLQSTGKSVSVDDVIAKIDKLTTDKA